MTMTDLRTEYMNEIIEYSKVLKLHNILQKKYILNHAFCDCLQGRSPVESFFQHGPFHFSFISVFQQNLMLLVTIVWRDILSNTAVVK